jgi:hypothetical protein
VQHRSGVRRSEQDDGPRRHTHDGGSPGGPSIGVGQHLHFVDHGEVHRRAEGAHLHRRRGVAAARHADALLAGQQSRGDTASFQRLAVFMREQAERA